MIAMMTAMKNSLGRFFAAVGVGWVALGVAAFLYARMKSIPGWAALPVAAAFLAEFPFYLLPGFEGPRRWLAGRGRTQAAGWIALSAMIPWLVYSAGTRTFHPASFAALLAIALAVAFWYVALPVTPAIDLLFLALLAAVILARVFDSIYAPPIPKLKEMSYLGHIMLIRTAALAMLLVRGSVTAEFRFLPTRREWLAGLRYFIFLLPVAGTAYWALGLVHFRARIIGVSLILATFFGILWVVALSEEFFFRGLLQQWLGRWLRSTTAGLICASLLFGSVHLGFGGHFPNWRFAIVAAIAGCFYGLAWRSTRTIQSGMVAHALTVTLWRVFLQ